MSWFNSDLSIGSRIDKFFISSSLVDFAFGCEIMPCCLSDHDFVRLYLDFKDLIPRGPGIWKFNNSLLENERFFQFVVDRILDLLLSKSSFDSVKQ